jgi:acyl-CoA hydrolase
MAEMDTDHYIEQHKSLAMTVLMTPDMANFTGYVHGGAILRLLDQVAYACASRYCNLYVITVSVDQVVFRDSIHVGELVTFLASVNYTGKSSMEIGVRVVSEDIRSKSQRHVMTCYFTMVAVDDDRKPTKVPELSVSTPTEKRRWKAAQLRRLLRKEIEERNLEIRLHPEDFADSGDVAPDSPDGDTDES